MWIKDLFYLFYPRVCEVCNRPLVTGEDYLCTKCIADLPKTRCSSETNKTHELFAGRFEFNKAYSFMYYNRDSQYAQLFYKLKYMHKSSIGFKLGKSMGYEIRNKELFPNIDYIIPIPLHWKRKYKRGYNQSEIICNGISSIINVPVNSLFLKRKQNNITQTKNQKWSRFSNVEGIFEIYNPDNIRNSKLLIVDDIITTGATIESICNSIPKELNCKINIASVGISTFN